MSFNRKGGHWTKFLASFVCLLPLQYIFAISLLICSPIFFPVFQVSTFLKASLSEFCEHLLSSPFKLHTQSILTCLQTNLKSK